MFASLLISRFSRIAFFREIQNTGNLNLTLIVQENYHICKVKNTRNSFFRKFANIRMREIFYLYSKRRERKLSNSLQNKQTQKCSIYILP